MNGTKSLWVVGLLAASALAAAVLWAQDGAAVSPRYGVTLQILPAEAGNELADDGETSARAYVVRLVVDSADDPPAVSFPELILYPGEKRSRSYTGQGLRISCEAAIDDTAERAAATVEIEHRGALILSQRFAVWLPASN